MLGYCRDRSALPLKARCWSQLVQRQVTAFLCRFTKLMDKTQSELVYSIKYNKYPHISKLRTSRYKQFIDKSLQIPMRYNVSTNHPSRKCPTSTLSFTSKVRVSQQVSICITAIQIPKNEPKHRKMEESWGMGCIPFRPSLGFCRHLGPRPNQS